MHVQPQKEHKCITSTSKIHERLNMTWEMNLNGFKVSPLWTNFKAAEIKKRTTQLSISKKVFHIIAVNSYGLIACLKNILFVPDKIQ